MRITLASKIGYVVFACLALLLGSVAAAAHRGPAAVPPTLEIEVLDPGVDPLGNPAVFLQSDEWGQLQVDIPPVVLVHRYYYSGDRSFVSSTTTSGRPVDRGREPSEDRRAMLYPGADDARRTACYLHEKLDRIRLRRTWNDHPFRSVRQADHQVPQWPTTGAQSGQSGLCRAVESTYGTIPDRRADRSLAQQDPDLRRGSRYRRSR